MCVLQRIFTYFHSNHVIWPVLFRPSVPMDHYYSYSVVVNIVNCFKKSTFKRRLTLSTVILNEECAWNAPTFHERAVCC